MNAPKKWKSWVVGITDRQPDFFDKPPSKRQLCVILIEAVRHRYRLKTEEEARRMAQALGTRLALCPPRANLLSHFRLADLESDPSAGR